MLKLIKNIHVICFLNTRFVLVFTLFFVSNLIKGQHLFFRHYTPDDGLPTSSLYNLVQDQDGFIWITSEAEVCKFDGEYFLSPLIGLEREEVIKLSFHAPDRLVFIDLTNQTFIYENNSLKQYDIPLYPKTSYLCSFYEDKNNRNWLVSTGVDYVISMPTASIFDTSQHTVYYNPNFNQPKAFHAVEDTVYLFSQGSTFKIIEDTVYSSFNTIEDQVMPPTIGMPDKNNVLISTYTGELYFYSKNADQFRRAFTEYDSLIQAGINYIYEDQLQNIWISTRDGLIFLDYQKNGTYKMSHHLSGTSVGIIYQDAEFQYWFTSLTDGLYFLPSLELSTYIHPKLQKIYNIAINQSGEILLGTDDGWLLKISENFEVQQETKLQRQSMRVYSIDAKFDTILYATSSQIFAQDIDDRFYDFKSGSYKQIDRSSREVAWYGSSGSMGYIDSTHEGYTEKAVLKQTRTYAVYPISDEACYFGAVDGLYYYDNDTLQTILPHSIQGDIRDIEILADSSLLLATQGNGLFRINHDSIIQHLTIDNGLVSNNCTDILVGSTYIWLATNKGLHRIDLDNNTIKLLSRNNGLVDDNVNCLALKGDTVLVGTNKGVAYFKEHYSLEESPPKVYFSSVKVGEKDTLIIQHYSLKHDQNNIKIGFGSIQFTNANSIEYQYKLKGLNDDWVQTKINEAQYPSLSNGNYEFMLRAKTINSDWSSPILLSFEIDKPFWKTWWFILCGIVFFGLMVYLFLRQFIKNKARKAKVEAQIKDMQLMALRAQMNPHFIFNSLNSIQEFIILQDKRTANRYLGQFSLLMRTILNMSEKETITLRQEIDALELYLSLESMRFEDELHFNISYDPTIKIDQTLLPPMLIQPYVENAILHGLRYKKGVKKLDVEFTFEPPFLICTVTDNGIGRTKAKTIKARKASIFPSKGMSITEKRLNLLNDITHQNFEIEVIDIISDQEEALGTKVIIQVFSNSKDV